MSRELDARVAGAMGWYVNIDDGPMYCNDGKMLAWSVSRNGCHFLPPRPEFRPSTDPAACEEVKRWLWKNGYGLVINNRKDRNTHRAFVSHVKYGEEARGDECGRAIAYCTKGHAAEADSEYEAVCLAFLAAVEGEKGAAK
jgi:hypothetical protein